MPAIWWRTRARSSIRRWRGSWEYRRSQDLTAEVGGEVTDIGAADYEQVSAGAVLVQLDGADYQKQVESVNKQITQSPGKDRPASGENRGDGGEALRLRGDR